jgi:hypothetical protein
MTHLVAFHLVPPCAGVGEFVKSWLKPGVERPITNVDLSTQEHTHES